MWGKNSANVTDTSAISVHGTNPQNLVEKILRSKIYNHAYWKEHCFGLTAESLVDKAMDINSVGGTFGGIREPTQFIQLILKMLQIQPEKEIVIEFIKNEDYKYVRVLGAFYLRLTGRPAEVYQYLEPLYNDYRKVRRRLTSGEYSICHMDELIEELLREDYVFDLAMPHLPKRHTLQASGILPGPRRSALEEDLDEMLAEEEAQAAAAAAEAEAEAATQRHLSRPPPPPDAENRRGADAPRLRRGDERGGDGSRADEAGRDGSRGRERGGSRGRERGESRRDDRESDFRRDGDARRKEERREERPRDRLQRGEGRDRERDRRRSASYDRSDRYGEYRGDGRRGRREDRRGGGEGREDSGDRRGRDRGGRDRGGDGSRDRGRDDADGRGGGRREAERRENGELPNRDGDKPDRDRERPNRDAERPNRTGRRDASPSDRRRPSSSVSSRGSSYSYSSYSRSRSMGRK